MAKISQTDAKQTRLPLSRDERLAAIDDIDPEDYGISRRAWGRVRDLLRQIEFQSAREAVCRLRVEVLAARMGVSERTVQRARRLAEGAGLLAVTERGGHNGQLSNDWVVDWCQLAGRAALTGEAHQPSKNLSPTGDVMSPPGDKMSPPGDVMSPPLRNTVLTSVPRSVPRSSDDGVTDLTLSERLTARTMRRDDHVKIGRDEEIDWEWVRREANRINPLLGRCRSLKDRSLLVKALVLSKERFGEHWLRDSVEGASRTDRVRVSRFAILHDLLDQKCVALGTSLNRELARIEVPEELLRGPPAAHDFGERLCIVR